jgi:thioredoxin 1
VPNATRFFILALVLAAAASVVILRGSKPGTPDAQAAPASAEAGPTAADQVLAGQTCDTPLPPTGASARDGGESRPATARVEAAAPTGVPRLLDLGSGTCTPCKMMVPVLEELRTKYKGKLQVDYISVVEDFKAAQRYGITVIPTQIFFDASGKELSRHVGFWPTADIVARFASHGIKLDSAPVPNAKGSR